jgi:hypothetical protein
MCIASNTTFVAFHNYPIVKYVVSAFSAELVDSFNCILKACRNANRVFQVLEANRGNLRLCYYHALSFDLRLFGLVLWLWLWFWLRLLNHFQLRHTTLPNILATGPLPRSRIYRLNATWLGRRCACPPACVEHGGG